MDIKIFMQRLLSISNAGINYSKDPYDIERFTEIFEMTETYINQNLTNEHIALAKEQGYPTPKVDVRAMVLNDSDEVLLVQDPKDETWSLPGGFAEVGISPVDNVIKETYEETGLEVEVLDLLAVYDTNKSNPENSLNHYYKMIYNCRRLSGILTESYETSDVKYFSLEDLPALSVKRNSQKQLIECFRNRNRNTIIE